MIHATPLPATRTAEGRLVTLRRIRWFRAVRQLVLVLFTLFAVLPIVFAGLASFKSLFDFYNDPIGLPTTWVWQNYPGVWLEANIAYATLNSLVIVAVTVPVVLVCSGSVAYGITQFRYRGNNVVYYLFLAGLIIPSQLTILPVVLLDKNLGLINTFWALILPYTGSAMPFAVFLLAGFMRTIPGELRDAALIDGANELQVFLRIIAPLLRPALATVAILNTVSLWNDFFFPLVVSPKIVTLQVSVYNLLGFYNTEWGHIFAGVIISAAPMVVAYLLLTKQFIAGLSAGAVKG